MEKLKIYLAGPINDCTDAEAKDWRDSVKEKLEDKYDFLDPMTRDYRGRELEPGIAEEIVNSDKDDIDEARIFLAYCPKPSVGTSMEILYAFETGKTVIVICPNKPSPWIVVHSDIIFNTLEEAITHLRTT